MIRLTCCQPIAYDGASQTLVHALTCPVSPEKELTRSEMAELKAKREHPAKGTKRPLQAVLDPKQVRRELYPEDGYWD